MKYLIIVESNTKAKKIQKFLGDDYRVVASNGHIRELGGGLKNKKLGIDIDNNFKPSYIIISGKGKHLI